MSFCEKLTKERKHGTGCFRQKKEEKLYTNSEYAAYFLEYAERNRFYPIGTRFLTRKGI